ncbi:MAG TPA: sel1 repeat family protein [Gammaproteobacteria bacterium]|nr:sel1 repeat family protein [Gammaproteobacteria bacterium]
MSFLLSPRYGALALLPLIVVTLGLPGCTSAPVGPAARTASPQEVSAAMFERAKLLYLSKDYAGAADLMRVLARRGHLEAQYVLGYMYYYGLGVPRNEKEAIRWITTAAARGHPKAMQALRVLDEGEPAPRPVQ